jgi:chloride channel 7
MLLITLHIAVGVALINFVMVQANLYLSNWKFTTTQAMMNHGAALGAVVLAGVSVGLVLLDACLVCFLAPSCAGSGVPEAKGYLNGNAIPGLFQPMGLPVRMIGVVLSVAAGLPVGREGPMVCIGGSFGYGVAYVFGLRYVKQWVRMNMEADECVSAAFMVDEERFAQSKRMGCTLGAAAGIATAFNAPIGGILYIFEEATVTSWSAEMTFRAFACSVLSALASRFLLNVSGTDVHKLVIFSEEEEGMVSSWHWGDIPFFVLLALLLGTLSAIYSRVLLAGWRLRKRVKMRFEDDWQKYVAIAEAIIFTMVCAFTWALLPLLVSCEPDTVPERHLDAVNSTICPGIEEPHHSHLTHVRHACPEGEHNPIATLLLTEAEGAVKHLYSRSNEGSIPLPALAITLVVYAILASCVSGLPVPMGTFVPSMLIGAMSGRFVGEVVNNLGFVPVAPPGVYALAGSAAMLGGFTHMTIAIVVLLVEAAHDLSLVTPLMLSIIVSRMVSTSINHHAFDEMLILQKGVPFLDAEIPETLDHGGIVAGDLCEKLPQEAMLQPMASMGEVSKALGQITVTDFPIVCGSACIGLVTRTRLEAALAARTKGLLTPGLGKKRSEPQTTPPLVSKSPEVVGECPSPASSISSRRRVSEVSAGIGSSIGSSLAEEDQAVNLSRYIDGLFDRRRPSQAFTDAPLPVTRIMDPAPYVLVEDMPVVRFYSLFSNSGASVACVISSRGDFRGLLSRRSLIKATVDKPARRPSDDSLERKDSDSAWVSESSKKTS